MARARVLAVLIIGALLLSMVGPHLTLAHPLLQPVNFSPDNGTDEIGPGHIFAARYDLTGADDGIYASQWQWRRAGTDNYDSPLYDTGISYALSTNPSERLIYAPSTMPAGVLEYGQTYWWHMRIQNTRGQWTEWSDETWFTTIVNTPPSQPENYSPNDDATDIPRNPVLAASEFRDPNYDTEEMVLGQLDEHAASQWQVTTVAGDYSSPVFESGEVTASDELTSFYIDLDHQLDPGTTYYWHVRYKDNYSNWSPWSDETSFTTGTSTSNVSQPINMSPFDGAIDISPDHELQSSPFYGEGGRTHFASQWEMAAGSSHAIDPGSGRYVAPVFSSPIDTYHRAAISMPEGVPELGGTYYWHVRYQDNLGAWSAWSDETSFTIVANHQPGTPVNQLPVNGATGVSVTPVLGASPFSDPDAEAYEAVDDAHAATCWQVTTVPGNYSSPVIDENVTDQLTSFYIDPTCQLDVSTTYYWRVSYADRFGMWSDWSAETSFTTEAEVPDFTQPVNVSPFDGASDISPDQQLRSSPFYTAGGRTHFASQWEMAAASSHATDPGNGRYLDPVFSSPIDIANLTAVYMPAGIPELGESYYWHVRYQDDLGTWSEWSNETSFTIVANHQPGTPVNQSPSNGATAVSLTPVLGASAFSDPDVSAYATAAESHAVSRWQVTTVAGNYSSPVIDESVTDQLTSFYIDADHQLDLGTTYYWHVSYRDSFGTWSAWSAETSFTTVTEVPDPSLPVNVSPFDGATDISPDHQMRSSPFYTGGGRTHFASQWEVAAASSHAMDPGTGRYLDPIFSSPIDVVSLTEISMPAGVPELGESYYWHVRYQDNTGAWSAWSDETSFTIVANHQPGTPVNQLPLNSATGVSVTPVLGASPFSDPDASAYATVQDSHAASQWQVRTSAGAYGGAGSFDSGIVTGSDQLTSFYIDPANDLALGTTYYWRVSYRDSFGEWSDWSAETSFSTVTSVPDLSLPVNVSPFNGATEISPDQPLQSSPFYTGGGRTHFASQWQMATAGATGKNADGSYQQPVFSSPIDRSSLTSISMPTGIPDLGGTYYWHVRYQDDLGTWSPWSVETSFTMVPNRAPSVPINKLPLDGASDVPVTPVLGASPFSDPDAAAYKVTTDSHAASQWQVRTSAGSYASPAFDSGTVTGTDQLTSCYIGPEDQLALNTTYYWHVRYRDSFDTWSNWSVETSFTTVTEIPDLTQPVNVSPFDGATEISPDQPLQASAFYTEGGRTHFASQWQVRTGSGSYASPVFSSPIDRFNLQSIALPAGTLDLGATYYWHVRYQNDLGAWSAWSDETSFTLVSNRTPDTPVNIEPAGGATGVSVTPTLGASPFDDLDTTAYSAIADSHAASQWQVRTSSGSYASPTLDTGTVTASSQLTGYYIGPDDQLAVSTTYYWRVRYQDSFGAWSGWSSETSFTTQATIPDSGQPVNVSPYNGATNISPDQALQSSPFYSVGGTTHQASYWQVAADGATEKNADGSYQQPLFDSRINSADLVSIIIPSGLTEYGKTYFWHVKYQDSTGAWSEWSDETSFTIVVNLPPGIPVNMQPVNGTADLGLTPVLAASAFSDYDASAYASLTDSHNASQWQVRSGSGDYDSPVWDSGEESAAAASIQVPAGELRSGARYFWHVRYQDSHGNWSAWSLETTFTTASIPAPAAKFTADRDTIVVGQDLVIFTDESTPAGNIARWSWDFGDGTTENWTSITRPSDGKVVHKYGSAAVGSREVTLTVYNAGSSTGVSKTMVVSVRTKPAASFDSPQSGRAGAAITITDTSDPKDGITSWEWWFDDGTKVTWASPEERDAAGGQVSHVFAKAGMHTVSLTVKGELGDSYFSQEIKVTGGGGLHFGIWMIGVALALVAVPAGGLYLLRNRKAK